MKNTTKNPTSPEETSTYGVTIYNFACGEVKITGATNIDVNPALEPEVVWDMTVTPYTFADSESVDTIYWFHGIEHVEKLHHAKILYEFRRILKDDGMVHIAYPEFERIARFWLDNYLGKRDFWEKTIYGLQSNPYDYHISLIHTPELKQLMEEVGFEVIRAKAETDQKHNTILSAKKGPVGLTREEGVKAELFG